jgi:hypothetical protein
MSSAVCGTCLLRQRDHTSYDMCDMHTRRLRCCQPPAPPHNHARPNTTRDNPPLTEFSPAP